jgi:hypothetical protein
MLLHRFLLIILSHCFKKHCRLEKTRFIFYERDLDPVSLAIELSVSLNQIDATVQKTADDMVSSANPTIRKI